MSVSVYAAGMPKRRCSTTPGLDRARWCDACSSQAEYAHKHAPKCEGAKPAAALPLRRTLPPAEACREPDIEGGGKRARHGPEVRSRHSTACSKKPWTIPSLHLVSCLRSQRYTPQGQVRDRRVHENVGVSRPAFDAEMYAWEEAQAAEQKVSLAVLWTSIPLHRALIFRTPRMYPHSHQGQAASAGVAGGNQFAISPLDPV